MDEFIDKTDRFYLVPAQKTSIKVKKIKKTAKDLQRDKIKEELQEVWLKYLNNGSDNNTFFEDIIDYILSKKVV